MKLVYPNYGLGMNFLEGYVNVLYIENPGAFSNMMGDFWKQLNGEEGGWILSEKEKTLNISKTVVGIYNPLALDCNERKVLNKVYAELSELAGDRFSTETSELNGRMVRYLEVLLGEVPYHLDANPELDLNGFLKLFDVKVDSAAVTLIEHIIDYLRVMHQVLRIEFFAFLNLKLYLKEDELQELYKFAIYEKINVLLIEGFYKIPCGSMEKGWILDEDLCIIEL